MQLLFCISNNYLLATPVQNFVFPFLFFFFKSTLAYSCTYFTLKNQFWTFFPSQHVVIYSRGPRPFFVPRNGWQVSGITADAIVNGSLHF